MRLSYSAYVTSVAAIALAFCIGAGAAWVEMRPYSLNNLELLMYEKRNWMRGKFVDDEDRCKKIFFFGDSTIASGIRPKAFDDLSHGRICAYNLAQVYHDMSKYIIFLRDAIKAGNRPDEIVTTLSYEREDVFVNGDWEEYRHVFGGASYLRYLRDRYFGAPTLSSVLRMSRNMAGLMEVRRAAERISDEGGAYWWGEGSLPNDFTDAETDRPNEEVRTTYSVAYRDTISIFFHLAESIHAPITLIEPPARIGNSKQRTCMPGIYKELIMMFPTTKIHRSGWKLKYYPPHLFFDRGHLNRDGATSYSREIYQEMTSDEVFAPGGPWPCLN
jgi:hypothetical protein